MDLQARKLELISWLTGIQDISKIQKLIDLKKQIEHDNINTELKQVLDEGLDSYHNEKSFSNDEIKSFMNDKYSHLRK